MAKSEYPLPHSAAVTVTGNRANLRVDKKMGFLAKDRRDTIIYNQHLKIENIPLEAYDYIVNGKSTIEWVIERYQVKTDKESSIINDPNDYAHEQGKPDYILNLLLSVIAVSLKTMEIVKALPDIGCT